MKKLLEILQNWLVESDKQIVPALVDDDENLLRNIFSPINVTKQNTLKTNAFRPPAGSEEISVNRIKYTNIDFCRDLGLKAQNPEYKRLFFGLADIKAETVRKNGADVFGSPIKNINPFHADIILAYKMVKGEQPPSEIAEVIRKLTKSAKLYIDPNPKSVKWEGEIINLKNQSI